MVPDSVPGSILTPTQREFLNTDDHADHSSAKIRMTRQRIRQRLGMAMVDCATILRELSEDDLDGAFLERIADGYLTCRPRSYIEDSIGLLYLGSVTTEESRGIRGLESVRTDDTYRDTPLIRTGSFERRAQKGIRTALLRRGVDVNDVTVSVELEVEGTIDPESDDLESLSGEELEKLRRAGQISEEEYIRIRADQLDIPIPTQADESESSS